MSSRDGLHLNANSIRVMRAKYKLLTIKISYSRVLHNFSSCQAARDSGWSHMAPAARCQRTMPSSPPVANAPAPAPGRQRAAQTVPRVSCTAPTAARAPRSHTRAAPSAELANMSTHQHPRSLAGEGQRTQRARSARPAKRRRRAPSQSAPPARRRSPRRRACQLAHAGRRATQAVGLRPQK
jgi:hypothetical protein